MKQSNLQSFNQNHSLSPPPYSQQAADSDWKHEIIEIQPLDNHENKYGFVISGGTDSYNGPWIIITHIEHCSKSSLDNGRTKLQLFDRILSMNNIHLTNVTHDEAVQAFSSTHGQSIQLHIHRLNPRLIEYIDCILPSDMSNRSLGLCIRGGLDNNNNIDDPGLFITYIDPQSILGLLDKFRLGDRLLEIRTNYTSANLRYISHALGIELIRRTCQDSKRVTFVISRAPIS